MLNKINRPQLMDMPLTKADFRPNKRKAESFYSGGACAPKGEFTHATGSTVTTNPRP